MAYVERTSEEIIQAYERYAAGNPKPDRVVIHFGNRSYSPRQLAKAMRDGDKDVLFVFVENVREVAKRLDFDPVEKIGEMN